MIQFNIDVSVVIALNRCYHIVVGHTLYRYTELIEWRAVQRDAVVERGRCVVVEREFAAVLNIVRELNVLRCVWLHVKIDNDSNQIYREKRKLKLSLNFQIKLFTTSIITQFIRCPI